MSDLTSAKDLGPWQRVRLVVIRPAGFLHVAALDEVIESTRIALQDLGADVEVVANEFSPDRQNLLFFGDLLDSVRTNAIPQSTVVYNFEQMFEGSPHLRPGLVRLFQKHTVWDYSTENVQVIRVLAGHDRVYWVPVGHVPQMARIVPAQVQDIDVLFYGSINERRQKMLLQIQAAGLNVTTLFAYGADRDAFIARAKVVLNLHYYPAQILETPRLAYLLSNAKCVATEWVEEAPSMSPSTRDAFRACVATASYDGLVALVKHLVHIDEVRVLQEDKARTLWPQQDLHSILRRAIQQTFG